MFAPVADGKLRETLRTYHESHYFETVREKLREKLPYWKKAARFPSEAFKTEGAREAIAAARGCLAELAGYPSTCRVL